jgi:Kef-type K+ transport system membrane component KefB
MEKVLLQIALILVATKVGGIAARKFKMPEVLGALIAGVLIGPVAFHLVAYDSNIKLLANLGVIMLMFLAGLETNLTEFKKAGLSAFVIAIAGITVPLLLGTLSAYLFFQDFWQNIFIGVILTATSVSITVETLAELGKLNTRVGINILGAAVIDDILGLIIISVLLAVSGKGGNSGSGSLAVMITEILAFCVISIIAILFLPKLLNKLLKDIQPSRTFLTFSIAAAMLAAFIAESVGIAAITGAYLCGLLLSQFVHKETLERGLKSISSGFLAPIFFASVGIETNLEGFSLNTMLIAICMLLVAVIGKVIGCGGAARIFKMSRSESLQVGVGMVSRGEVAIITANIGLQAGIINNQVFLPTILVVILTTIITPVLLKLSFSHRYETLLRKEQ